MLQKLPNLEVYILVVLYDSRKYVSPHRGSVPYAIPGMDNCRSMCAIFFFQMCCVPVDNLGIKSTRRWTHQTQVAVYALSLRLTSSDNDCELDMKIPFLLPVTQRAWNY